MARFLLQRLGAAIVLLLVLSFLIFVLQQVSPGDPARAYLGANASAADVAAQRHALGLDQPLATQYLRFLVNAVQGDLGRSLRTRHDVTADIGSYLPATVELVLSAFVVALVLAAAFALSGALRWRPAAPLRGLLLVAAMAPPFLLALGGIVVFYARLGWLPNNGRGGSDPGPTGLLVLDSLLHGQLDAAASAVEHLVLPAGVLAIAPAIAIGRIFRSSLDTTLHADYVRTARSKGLGEGAVLRSHVMRNSLGPALSMAGLQLGFMFAGVVVVEQVFSWPGIGNYLAASIPVADFPAIAGVTLVLGAVYILANTAVDLLQAAADPRIARN
jgi:peptide/nickel transport system permease protein